MADGIQFDDIHFNFSTWLDEKSETLFCEVATQLYHLVRAAPGRNDHSETLNTMIDEEMVDEVVVGEKDKEAIKDALKQLQEMEKLGCCEY